MSEKVKKTETKKKSSKYYVCHPYEITSLIGILKSGDEVFPKYLKGGKKHIEELVSLGHLESK